jgi:hypothetical protein
MLVPTLAVGPPGLDETDLQPGFVFTEPDEHVVAT